MKKRFKFTCWNCHRVYSLFKEISDEQVLIVPCPFCHSKGVVDLGLYPRKVVILRGQGNTEQQVEEPELPEVLPTHKPE